MRPIGSAEELERRRFRAVRLIQEGVPRKWIARVLGVPRGTLSRWCKLAEAGALQAKPQPGAPRRLTDQNYRELEELLAQGATAHGWPNNLWTAGRVGEVIERHFQVKYHPAHVSRILKNRLGWTCQRPVHQRWERDDAEIDKWVKGEFPRIVKEARERRASLVFVDETGFMLGPTVRRTYSPCGRTPVHRVSAPHARISVIGAIIVGLRRKTFSLAYDYLADNANFNGSSVVGFLRTLHTILSSPMTVIWDQIQIHSCDPVEQYLARTGDIIVEPFPPYAPELNPADGIWRYIKYNRLANYTPTALDELRSTMISELDRLRERPDLLRSFIDFTRLPLDL
jgi:transposase